MNLSRVTVFAVSFFVIGLTSTATVIAFSPPTQVVNRASDTGHRAPVIQGDDNKYPAQGLPVRAMGKPEKEDRPEATSGSQPQGKHLQACQAGEDAIKNRSVSLVRMVINMEAKFDAILSRVEVYYTSKVVPSGKTVTNYSSLTSETQTKKAAIQTALVKAQDDISSFSCNNANPKGQMIQFKQDMQSVKQALQDYRTSIKNLVVAVHSVIGEENKSATTSAKAKHD